MALALAGCGPEVDHIDFHYQTGPSLGATVDEEGIVIPEGIAVSVLAQPVDDDGDVIDDEEIQISLATSDANVLGVKPAAVDERNVFVIYGVAPGSASVEARVDGEFVSTIPAAVQAQP
jgi:hypothetical protein